MRFRISFGISKLDFSFLKVNYVPYNDIIWISSFFVVGDFQRFLFEVRTLLCGMILLCRNAEICVLGCFSYCFFNDPIFSVSSLFSRGTDISHFYLFSFFNKCNSLGSGFFFFFCFFIPRPFYFQWRKKWLMELENKKIKWLILLYVL